MTSMIERVAAAIWLLNEDTDCTVYAELAPFAKEKANAMARAAILAMREPTDGMVYSGADAARKKPAALEAQVPGAQQMRAGWQAMIDAALQEKPDV